MIYKRELRDRIKYLSTSQVVEFLPREFRCLFSQQNNISNQYLQFWEFISIPNWINYYFFQRHHTKKHEENPKVFGLRTTLWNDVIHKPHRNFPMELKNEIALLRKMVKGRNITPNSATQAFDTWLTVLLDKHRIQHFTLRHNIFLLQTKHFPLRIFHAKLMHTKFTIPAIACPNKSHIYTISHGIQNTETDRRWLQYS